MTQFPEWDITYGEHHLWRVLHVDGRIRYFWRSVPVPWLAWAMFS